MTKDGFATALQTELVTRYAWAQDADKLARFMASVRATLDGGMTWNNDGDAALAAWRAIGGKGKPTYKALHALA